MELNPLLVEYLVLMSLCVSELPCSPFLPTRDPECLGELALPGWVPRHCQAGCPVPASPQGWGQPVLLPPGNSTVVCTSDFFRLRGGIAMEKKCSYPWKKLPVVNFCGSLARKEKKNRETMKHYTFNITSFSLG